MADLGKSSTGIQPNVAALLAYLVGFVSGLVFFLIEKENKFVRFHAMQSIGLSGGLFVLAARECNSGRLPAFRTYNHHI